MEKCVYCGVKEKLLEHHIRYNPEETVIVCKSCHFKITRMIQGHVKGMPGNYLCKNCGRHYTSNKDKLCWYCKPENQKKRIGLV